MTNNKELIIRQQYLHGFVRAGKASELSIKSAKEELVYEVAPQLATALEQAEAKLKTIRNDAIDECLKAAREECYGYLYGDVYVDMDELASKLKSLKGG